VGVFARKYTFYETVKVKGPGNTLVAGYSLLVAGSFDVKSWMFDVGCSSFVKFLPDQTGPRPEAALIGIGSALYTIAPIE